MTTLGVFWRSIAAILYATFRRPLGDGHIAINRETGETTITTTYKNGSTKVDVLHL